MRRRIVRLIVSLTVGIGLLLLASPHGATNAQSEGKVFRVGYLDQGSARGSRPYVEAFRSGLHDRGWVEGENITIESRFADGRTDRLLTLAAELVRLRVDVIVTRTTPAALAAKQATTTIPIVFGAAADPVGSGIVSSLARPGGNITGWTHRGLELRAKYLELLKEAIPGATRFGVLWNPTNHVHRPSLKVIEAAARQLGVDLQLVGVQDPKELENTFAVLVARRVDALVVFPDGMFRAQLPRILALAAQSRLPTMFGDRAYAEDGGLMAYGANMTELHRRLGASFVDRILRGATPAQLPVEQPTTFELIINLKTARTLGLTLSPAFLARVDQVIQ